MGHWQSEAHATHRSGTYLLGGLELGGEGFQFEESRQVHRLYIRRARDVEARYAGIWFSRTPRHPRCNRREESERGGPAYGVSGNRLMTS